MMRTLSFRLTLLMIFTLLLENSIVIPGIGRISKLMGIVVAVVWLIAVAKSGRMRQPLPAHVFAFLFVLWNACSMFWTVDGPATQARVITYVGLFVFMLVIWDTTTTLRAVRQALFFYLLGSCVTATCLLGLYAAGFDASEDSYRVTVFGFHPNDIGMFLALAVPVAAYFIASPGSERWRSVRLTISALYVPVTLIAVLYTGSRSALVGMLPGLVYLAIVVARRRPTLALGTLAALGFVAILAIPHIPARIFGRLSGTASAVEAGDLNKRQYVWAEAVRLFEENPISGIGGGAFRTAAVGVNKVAHNFVLALLAEVGIVGFGLFAATVICALWSLRRMKPLLAWMWVSIFSAWFFGALFQNLEYRKHTWFFLGLVLACGYVSDKRVAHQAEDAAVGQPEPAPVEEPREGRGMESASGPAVA